MAYQRAIAHAVGDALSGLLFSQLWYWTGRQPEDRNGWFFMTQEQITAETAITRREQETCRRKLRGLGILEEARRGHPAKLWFRINVRAVIQLIEKTARSQNGGKRQTSMAENAILDWRKAPYKNGGKRHPSKNTTKRSSKTSAASGGAIAVVCVGNAENPAGDERMPGVSASPGKEAPGELGVGVDAAAALIETLVLHGVGRTVAEKLARLKPEVCKRCLEYLPYAKYRTTKGAWLANAIAEEFGPPAGYEKAVARQLKEEKMARGEGVENARQRAKEAQHRTQNARLIERYGRMEKERPGAKAAFMEHLQRERARAERFANNLSAAGRERYFRAFDSQEGRLRVFAEWLSQGGNLAIAEVGLPARSSVPEGPGPPAPDIAAQHAAGPEAVNETMKAC